MREMEMMQMNDFTRISEHERVVELMVEILDFDKERELKIRRTLKNISIRDFFLNINSLDFDDDVKEKVNALNEIIGIIDNNEQGIVAFKEGYQDDK